MNSEISPFKASGPVPVEKVIVSQEKAKSVFGHLTYEGGSVAVYGDHGMGKSSLLCYIADPPAFWREKYFQNHIFVAFNCPDTVSPFTPADFWYQTIRHLDRKVETGPIKEKCQALLAQQKEGSKLNQHDFHDILDVAAEEGKHIVLVLDDFGDIIWKDSEHFETTRMFLQGLRSLITRYSNKANLVVATRCSLEELCKPMTDLRLSPFSNGFTGYRLQLFRDAEMDQLIQLIEETTQPPFSSEEAEYIRYLSGFHPQLAQIVADEIFDQRSGTNKPLDDLTPVGERFKSKARHVFESLWREAGRVERMLLMLITLQKLEGKLPKRRYDLSDIPVIFSQWERELIELADRGLLRRTKTDPPTWEIFSPIFDWWVLKEIESADPEQLDEYRKVCGNLLTKKQIDRIWQFIDVVRENMDLIEEVGRGVIQMTGLALPFAG